MTVPKTSNSIVCTAVTLSTVSIIGTSTSWPRPVRSANSSAARVGERRMRAREWIAGTARGDRRTVGQAGHPGQTRDLLHRLCESDPLPARDRTSRMPAYVP